jgi:hypothetical protein
MEGHKRIVLFEAVPDTQAVGSPGPDWLQITALKRNGLQDPFTTKIIRLGPDDQSKLYELLSEMHERRISMLGKQGGGK